MGIFKKDDRVSLKRNNTQKGTIDNVLSPQGGYQFYEVMFDDGSLQIMPENDIIQEVKVKSPWDLIANNSLNDYRYFSISTTIHKVQNTASNTISTLKASRTIFKPYQFKPLVKFLKSDLQRILIADEVGLGKTIEAGHIMLEKAARGNLLNALVICTKSLSGKWQSELQDKFPFNFKIYETIGEFIRDIKIDIAGSKKSVFGILNYEKCRKIDKLLNAIEENNYRFDLLICDEAHKIRNSETAQHKGVAKIVDQSDSVIFMTATPIMTDIRNLHSLIRILDRQGFDTYDVFSNALNQNRPFIRALSQLNANVPYIEIAEQLHNTVVVQEMTVDKIVYDTVKQKIGELFKNDILYQRAYESMINGIDSIENRVKIQQDLIELNSLNHIYTRTRKRDVLSDKDLVKREPRKIPVSLSEVEREIYESVVSNYDPKNLGLISLKRQMSSCIVAYISKQDLETGNYNHDVPDSKFSAFKIVIENVVINNRKKLIVFAFFTSTLLYLKIKLNELGIETEIIHGKIKDRSERIERFKNDKNIKVLLSSEVGSEGIDLQFCDALVNYDLPWNPMVVEQRIGRIDRVGQESPIINIYNLVINDTIEDKIYEKLYNRINLFKESIGDLEEILGENDIIDIEKEIENLYKTELNKKEQEERLDQIARAFENEKQNLYKIKEDLQTAFANDLHFDNEIKNIENNKRYLTKDEIIKFLESVIVEQLSSLQLYHINENVSELSIPSNNKSFFDFIEKYKGNNNSELDSMYRKFKAKYYNSKVISLTFDQKYAFENKKHEFISALHPLVNAITNYFSERGFEKNQANKISLKKESLVDSKKILAGFYLLIIYNISVTKEFGDGRKNQLHFLKCALADINGETIKILDSDISDHVYGMAQLYGEKFKSDIKLNKKFVDEVRPFFAEKIYKDEKIIKQDEEIKFISGIKRRTEQEINYKNKRIERMEWQLIEKKGIEAILKKEIGKLNQEKEQLILNEKKAKLETSQSLISVNLLQII